jgi:mevalonate kinase
MTAVMCSAPGKLFLGGEYAVLDGAEAVVTAVSRRATAELATTRHRSSKVVDAAVDAVERFLERGRGAPLPPFVVTSKGFTIDRRKIGLGSSAAVAASSCGQLFELAGLPIETHRERILEVATTAHRNAQSGKGSGADVATSVQGGTLVFRTSGVREKVTLKDVVIVAVWSGKSISTTVMIERINAFRAADSARYDACFGGLVEHAAILAGAYRERTSKRIIESTREYGNKMKALGQAAGVPIVTPELSRIAAVAADLGGGAKPSGAGGGDVAVGVFEARAAAEEFRVQCLRHGFRPLELTVDEPGLRREG